MRSLVVVAVTVLLGGCAIEMPAPRSASHDQLADAYRLGVQYLLAAQTPAGDFTYAYDWVADRVVPGNNLVRQAGAAWVLALAYQRDPSPDLQAAVERSLGYFDRGHGTTPDGARYVRIPGHVSDGIGAIALVSLAELAYIRTGRGDVAEHTARLDGYLRFILAARRDDGMLFGTYATDDGAHAGDPSPYGDGEALLALAMTARYLDREDLRTTIADFARAAVTGHADETKAFYQWSTMALYELIGTGWPEFQPYAKAIFDMTDWELGAHHLVRRKSNVAYALEGLIPAAELARSLGDTDRADRYARAVQQLLGKLLALQIGSATANGFIRAHDPERRAIGGVQSERSDPVLRIDVTQHQTHAVMQAMAMSP